MEEGAFGTAVHRQPSIWYPNSVCEVCTAPATGVHYGIVACEGCKAFYRRSMVQNSSYKCYLGSDCNVGPQTKGRCRACRLQGCLRAGMKLETTKMGRVPLRRREVGKALSGLKSPKKIAPLPVFSGPECSILPRAVAHTSNTTPKIIIPLPSAGKLVAESNFSPHSQEITITHPPLTVEQPVSAQPVDPTREVYIPPEEPNERTKMDEAQSLRRSTVISFVPRNPQIPLERFCPHADHQSCLSTNHSRFETPEWFSKNGWRDMRNESTIKAVSDLIPELYGDSYGMMDAFMHACLVDGNIPYQPQVSLQVAIDSIVQSTSLFLESHCKLARGLPGYSKFSQADQQILVSDNWMASRLVAFHKYYRNYEVYHPFGPFQIHYGMYWLQQVLEPEYIGALFACTDALNKLKLSRVESFLLLAITMFTPGSTEVENNAQMSFLHSHYTDCLISLFRSNHRGTTLGTSEYEQQVLAALGVLRKLNMIAKAYVRTLDLTKAPFRPKEGSTVISIPEIMESSLGS